MAATVVSFFQRYKPSCDWTQRELAEFYRVENALIQAGLRLETDRGVTDEGDPWFVFCRSDTGEVFIHFARIKGEYIAVGAALEQVVKGKDFPTLIQEMLADQALTIAKSRGRSSNIYMHPASLLIALVGAAFFHSGEAKAADAANHAHAPAPPKRFALPLLLQGAGEGGMSPLDAAETNAILSSVLTTLRALNLPAPAPVAEVLPTVPADSALDLAPPPPGFSGPAQADVVTSAPLPATAIINIAAAGDDVLPAPQADASGVKFALSLPTTPGQMIDAAASSHAASVAAPLDVHAPTTAPTLAGAALLADVSDASAIFQSSGIVSFLATPASAPLSPPPVINAALEHGAQLALVDPTGPSASTTHDHATGGSPSPPPVSAPPASGAPAELAWNSPVVKAALAEFSAEVGQLDVATTNHEIVLYDGSLFHAGAVAVQLESFTFTFPDGSSIALVGTAAELQHLHLPSGS